MIYHKPPVMDSSEEGDASSLKERKKCSFEDLPQAEWIKEPFTKQIEPTIISYAGTLDQPWELDYESDPEVQAFGDVLTQAVDIVREDLGLSPLKLDKMDVIWQYVRSK